jgi:hypothetical protein
VGISPLLKGTPRAVPDKRHAGRRRKEQPPWLTQEDWRAWGGGGGRAGNNGLELTCRVTAAWLTRLERGVRSSLDGGAATWAREGSAGKGGRQRRMGSIQCRWKPRRFSPTRFASFPVHRCEGRRRNVELTTDRDFYHSRSTPPGHMGGPTQLSYRGSQQASNQPLYRSFSLPSLFFSPESPGELL